MRRLRRVFLILAMICMFGMAPVCAMEDNIGDIVDGSVLTNKSEVSGDTLSNTRGTYLSYGSATLTDLGNKKLNVSGFTSCYKTCDQVKVTLHLQRLVNGTWTTVTTLGPKVAYNDHYVSRSGDVTVTGGYYYRISGSHVAVKGKTTESTYSSTDGMWVSK